jgi:hypothetical protein
MTLAMTSVDDGEVERVVSHMKRALDIYPNPDTLLKTIELLNAWVGSRRPETCCRTRGISVRRGTRYKQYSCKENSTESKNRLLRPSICAIAKLVDRATGNSMNQKNVSIIMPAKNEASAIRAVIESIRRHVPDAEILIIDDGSTDDTATVSQVAGARVVSHPYSMGNGAAIKTGARSAVGDVLVFMDADGQHDPADIPRLLKGVENGVRNGSWRPQQ